MSWQVAAVSQENYAQLLRRAVMCPETLTGADRAKITPGDKALIAGVLDFHSDTITSELARRKRANRTDEPQPPVRLITDRRWQQILTCIENGTFLYTSLSIDEILAIDTDADLSAQYTEALQAAG